MTRAEAAAFLRDLQATPLKPAVKPNPHPEFVRVAVLLEPRSPKALAV